MATRKFLLFVALCSLIHASAWAQFIDATKSYRIASLSQQGEGGIMLNDTRDAMVYDKKATLQTATATWKFTEVSSGKYTIKNITTNKYLQYAAANSRFGFILTSKLQTNGSTYFRLEQALDNPNAFVIIADASKNPEQAFDLYGGEMAIGSWEIHRQINQQFLLIDKEQANDPIGDFFNLFTLDGKELTCNLMNGYAYTIRNTELDQDISKTIEYSLKDATITLYIDGVKIENNTPFIFKGVNGTKDYTLEFRRGSEIIATSTLCFTTLPIVEVTTDSEINGGYYTPGNIRVIDPETKIPAEHLNANLRYRGGMAQSLPKKSFAVKLKNSDYSESIDRSFFGLREDNNWILDAMAIDLARMRNRVSTDLWNDFARLPYYASSEPEMINGTRGRFVEVYVNKRYAGLYCMTEKIDRKQLKLKKYQPETGNIRGELYKSADWTFSTFLGHYIDQEPDYVTKATMYDNNSETWDGWEAKYPDLGDGEKIDWKPLYDLVNFVATASNSSFTTQIASRMDLPLFVDYYLFSELLMATDNHGKNMYLYLYNKTVEQKFCMAPWDLDGTWGRRWNSDPIEAEQDFTDFIKKNEHGEYLLYTRLKETNSNNFNELVKARWNELRGNLFAAQNLIKRFSDYKEMIVRSGAAQREAKKWGATWQINFENELTYLNNWIIKRYSFLNAKWGSTIYTTGDSNGDGTVNVADIVNTINHITGTPVDQFIFEAADINSDGNINVADVVDGVNLIIKQEGKK